MNNQANNPYKFTARNSLHPSGNDPQRPLIDVARSYCNNLNPSTPSRSNAPYNGPAKINSNSNWSQMKENKSVPVSSPGFSAYTNTYSPHGSPYTGKANKDFDNGRSPPVPNESAVSRGLHNPYSWRASSKSPATTKDSRETTPNSSFVADPLFPRPPRLPKLEQLTVSVSKDSDVRTVGEGSTQKSPLQSPLQPFSPTGDCRECTCLRNPKVILCQSCGLIQKGRLSMACAVHPRQVFLMDLNCCAGCKSTSLKEICDAKKQK